MSCTLVLVTGGRKYGLGEDDEGRRMRNHIYATLNAIKEHYGEIMLICGGAPGLDAWAQQWANDMKIHCAVVKAIWNKLGNLAGPIRNSMMLKLRPDVCVAFPGGPGTADMVEKARAAGVQTYEV